MRAIVLKRDEALEERAPEVSQTNPGVKAFVHAYCGERPIIARANGDKSGIQRIPVQGPHLLGINAADPKNGAKAIPMPLATVFEEPIL
jgi:hypothetical protein